MSEVIYFRGDLDPVPVEVRNEKYPRSTGSVFDEHHYGPATQSVPAFFSNLA